jgi:ketosteroid isomerase-like protein
MNEGSDVIGLISQRHAAISWHDAEFALEQLAADAEIFDLAPLLVQAGTAARDAAALQAWLDEWIKGPDISLAQPTVRVDGDLAVVWGMAQLRGAKRDGNADLGFRLTIVLERDGSDWRIVHQHESVPAVTDGSLNAAVDLQP